MPSQSPAYGFFLIPKSERERTYNIMHLFREDIDRRIPDRDIRTDYQIPAFEENLLKGIEYLQTGTGKIIGRKRKGTGLEQTLGIISILSMLFSIFLISNNLTGFTIANLSSSSSNKIGICLIFGGLIAAFFLFKRNSAGHISRP